MIQAGIIGAAGYTGGELMRILINHPWANILYAQSESHAGEPVWSAHRDLIGETSLSFCAQAEYNTADVIFLCMGHGRSRDFVASLPGDFTGKIVDLSQDYRLRDTCEGFVYGLPEAFREEIKRADRVANPGCFATAIQLALLPMARHGSLGEVHVTAITGSTGAGQKPGETTHFSWREGNLSVYKCFEHQHLAEINETLSRLQPDFGRQVNFVPVRGCHTRGIMASVYFDSDLPEDSIRQIYADYYHDEPFVRVVEVNPDLKMVVNTNKCVMHVRKHGPKVHVVSFIDNLVKGASGQAVENMNLMFGLPEVTGLNLKPVGF